MQSQEPKNMPFVLLGRLGQTSSLQGLPLNESGVGNPRDMQELTTAYITTMYYAALSNLYLQTILPPTQETEDIGLSRVKLALERSFADFNSAINWLSANGGDFILNSTAKQMYDEAQGMDKSAVKDTATFYAS